MAVRGQFINYETLSTTPYGSYVMMDNDTGSYQDGYFYTSSPGICIISYLSHAWALFGNASHCNVYLASYDLDTGVWTSESQVISNAYDSTDSTANRTKYVSKGINNRINKYVHRWRIDMSSKGHKIITAVPYGVLGVGYDRTDSTSPVTSLKDSTLGGYYYRHNCQNRIICGLGNLANTGKERFIYVYGAFAQNDAGAIAYFSPSSNRGRTIYAADEYAIFPKGEKVSETWL